MDSITIVVLASIVVAAVAIAAGLYAPAKAMGGALTQALESIARQPESANQIIRALLVGMALIEALAIYVFVIVLIILFANPLLAYLKK
ncbi:MAG: ATP synthase F0 subunit C [Nitrospinae bacterium]|nr:ATP synthase F0 subunit C [Nitrospinota bacterium]